ncbi:hypothetical protein ABZ801_00950 [Actinomadura sp. NPDC047616]|uniref:hypothetical protein n=1 Tax=Actinomadura sp. NPDC047616 TaxID=3155914 RepID=UPI00340326BB
MSAQQADIGTGALLWASLPDGTAGRKTQHMAPKDLKEHIGDRSHGTEHPSAGNGNWEAIRENSHRVQVLSSGHSSPEGAAEWLGGHFDTQAENTDWPPTRAQWKRAAAQIRRRHQTRAFGSNYRIRRTRTDGEAE